MFGHFHNIIFGTGEGGIELHGFHHPGRSIPGWFFKLLGWVSAINKIQAGRL